VTDRTRASMEPRDEGEDMAHACWPPTHRRRIHATATWTCPECGDPWTPRMTGQIQPEPVLPFDIPDWVSTADWLRIA
jgi:hypothetical protein